MLFDEPLGAQDMNVRGRMTDQLVRLTHSIPSSVEGEREVSTHPTTVLVVTHSLDMLDKFDYVLFIDKRTSADFGPLSTLMEARGPLWQFIFRSALVSVDSAGHASLTNDGLKRLPMFSKLPDEMLTELGGRFLCRIVQKGDVIFRQVREHSRNIQGTLGNILVNLGNVQGTPSSLTTASMNFSLKV
jgi:ABC-type multidrug transport system ATPase subunit